MADLAQLAVKVTSDGVGKVSAELAALGNTAGVTEGKLSGLQKAAVATGVALGAAFIGREFVANTVEAQNATAQLEAVLRSTGGAAGQSLGALQDYAKGVQRLTGYSDEAVNQAQALLLTFGEIKGDTFPAATTAVLDLAQAMGGDLKGAAIQIGKALQDPEQGLTALTRSGVSFSDAQKQVIKDLFDTGHQAEAQALILKELTKEFGGSAEAARHTLGGALKGLENDFGDLFEVEKDGTRALVHFIENVGAGVRELNELKGAATGAAVALGAAGVAGGAAAAVVALGAAVGGIASVSEALIAARLYATAFWAAVIAPATIAVVGLTAVAALMGKLLNDDAKANEAMKAREEADKYMVELALKRRDARLQENAAISAGRQAAMDDLAAATKKLDLARQNIDLLTQQTAKERELAALMDKVNRSLDERAYKQRAAEVLPKLTPGGPATQGSFFTGILGGSFNGLGGGGGTSNTLAALGMPGSLLDDWKTIQAKLTETSNEEREKARVFALAKVEEELAKEKQLRENFLRGLQETFARTFESIFTKGLRSFSDLFDGLKQLAIQTFAQIAAMKLTGALTDAYKTGSADGGGVSGGISGVLGLMGGPAGAVAIGVAAIGAGLLSSAQAAKAHAAALNNAALNFAEHGRDYLGRSPEQEAYKSYQAAREAAGRDFGNLSYGNKVAASGDFNALMDAMYAAYQVRLQNLAAEKKFTEDMASSDLRARALRTSGFTDEADALDLWNRQVDEFHAAVEKGYSETYLAALAQQQAMERAALAAKQAADAQQKLAEAQKEYARQAQEMADRVVAAQQHAIETLAKFADASDDLSVRMLRATGQMAAADARAFELQQKRELRAVDEQIVGFRREAQAQALAVQNSRYHGVNESGMPYLDYDQARAIQGIMAAMEQQIAAALAYKDELKAVQAAEATAFAAGANGNTLPGVSATTHGGNFNTVMSQATAEQSDRMVDNLVTMRTVIQEYLPYLKTIATRLTGGVDALMGSAFQNTTALAGSSLVT